MRKLFVLCLAGAVVFGVMAGCSKKQEPIQIQKNSVVPETSGSLQDMGEKAVDQIQATAASARAKADELMKAAQETTSELGTAVQEQADKAINASAGLVKSLNKELPGADVVNKADATIDAAATQVDEGMPDIVPPAMPEVPEAEMVAPESVAIPPVADNK